MDATKVADSPIASAAEFHETLADAFSTAAETAVWLAQFNCGWADPNAEAVGRLKRLVPMVDRLTRASGYLQSFAEARIATKADSEAAKFQGPDGEWYASYHDSVLGLIVGLLNYVSLPHYNEAGQVESYRVPSDPMNASQNDRIRGRQWFDQVKGEYLVGMSSEAAAASASEPSGDGNEQAGGQAATNEAKQPTLTKEAAAVLRYLAKRHPVLSSLEDVTLNVNECLAKATAKKAIDDLRGVGYAERPHGETKGVAATNAGLAVAAKLSTKLEQT